MKFSYLSNLFKEGTFAEKRVRFFGIQSFGCVTTGECCWVVGGVGTQLFT